MSLVPLLTAEQFSAEDRVTLAQGVNGYGRVLNTWAAIGNSPGLFAVYLPFLRKINGPGALDERLKDIVAVRVAVLNHCRYTTSHRCASARVNGVTLDELRRVANRDLEAFSDRDRVALVLAEEMTTSVPRISESDSITGISSSVREDAVRTFAPAELVELVMCISVWNALSRFHRVMMFELDMPDAPTDVEACL